LIKARRLRGISTDKGFKPIRATEKRTNEVGDEKGKIKFKEKTEGPSSSPHDMGKEPRQRTQARGHAIGGVSNRAIKNF